MSHSDVIFLLEVIDEITGNLPDCDLDPIIKNLDDLLNSDRPMDDEDARTIGKAVSDLRGEAAALGTAIASAQDSAYLGYLSAPSPDQRWRLEPYPWLGAPAAPLLTLA